MGEVTIVGRPHVCERGLCHLRFDVDGGSSSVCAVQNDQRTPLKGRLEFGANLRRSSIRQQSPPCGGYLQIVPRCIRVGSQQEKRRSDQRIGGEESRRGPSEVPARRSRQTGTLWREQRGECQRSGRGQPFAAVRGSRLPGSSRRHRGCALPPLSSTRRVWMDWCVQSPRPGASPRTLEGPSCLDVALRRIPRQSENLLSQQRRAVHSGNRESRL